MIITTIFILLALLQSNAASAQENSEFIDNRLIADSTSDGYIIIRQYQRNVVICDKHFFTKKKKPSLMSHFVTNRNSVRLFVRQGFEDTLDLLINGIPRYTRYLKKDRSGEIYNGIFDLDSLISDSRKYTVTIKFRHAQLFLKFEINRKYDFIALYLNARSKTIHINNRYYRNGYPIISM